MNIDHLRKQAKNLKSLYPSLVATHGATLTLSQVQDAVARSHGFPSWAAVLGKSEPTRAPKARRAGNAAVGPHDDALTTLIRTGYRFEPGEPRELAVDIGDGGEPLRRALGRELVLRFCRATHAIAVRREDRALDQIADRFETVSGTFDEYTPPQREILLRHAREAVGRCPLYLDGWNRVAGVLFEERAFEAALAALEPVARGLRALLPAGVVQVCYGLLEHRPFYRVMHTYLLLLNAVGRHAEADALAQQMLDLWPMDNVGFRFLLTREDRGLP